MAGDVGASHGLWNYRNGKTMNNIRFVSLSSGSSGNCYYLGTDSYGILIDAGISARQIKKSLAANGIAFESIVALCIMPTTSKEPVMWEKSVVFPCIRRRRFSTV